MRPTHAELPKKADCKETLENFRRTLTEVKAELYPGMTDEELCYTRDEAGAYYA